MSSDLLTRVQALDPADTDITAPDDLLERLVAEPRETTPAQRPRSTHRWVPTPRARGLGLALAVAAAITVAIALPGGAGHAPTARAELIKAARHTAHYDSGIVTWRSTFEPPISTFTAHNVLQIRFDGPNFQMTSHGEPHAIPGDFRIIGRDRYEQIGSGPWKHTTLDQERGTETRADDELHIADQLEQLAQQATDVQRVTSGDETTFTFVVDPGQLPVYSMGPPWPKGQPVVVTVSERDEQATRFALRTEHQSWEVDFDQLGQPQQIDAP